VLAHIRRARLRGERRCRRIRLRLTPLPPSPLRYDDVEARRFAATTLLTHGHASPIGPVGFIRSALEAMAKD
jgi:hypothetical protein